ncbi:MAG TPA: CPBP family intramembrane glutamic endopeptidase [Phenylobacterium sp.]|jgi:hypothetical protein
MGTATDPASGPPGVRLGALVDLGLAVVALLACGLFALALHRLLPKGDLTLRLAAPGEMLILVGAATLLLRRRGERWRGLGLARPASWRRVAALVAAGYVAAIAINAVCVLLLFPALGLKLPSFAALGAVKGDAGAYLYWLLLAWISAALGEELLFRGFILSRLERLFGAGRGPMLAALVLQALLFSLGHLYQGPAGAIVTGGLGLVLGGVYLAGRRNLVACMLLHGLIDSVSITAMFLGAVPSAAVSG